ncbi:hypothetical protein [Paraglaciecola arctica]|nr:hypothetical protein [Paraglaciecola arctica]
MSELVDKTYRLAQFGNGKNIRRVIFNNKERTQALSRLEVLVA